MSDSSLSRLFWKHKAAVLGTGGTAGEVKMGIWSNTNLPFKGPPYMGVKRKVALLRRPQMYELLSRQMLPWQIWSPDIPNAASELELYKPSCKPLCFGEIKVNFVTDDVDDFFLPPSSFPSHWLGNFEDFELIPEFFITFIGNSA